MPSDFEKKASLGKLDKEKGQVSIAPDDNGVVDLSEGLGESILTVGNVQEKVKEVASEDGSSAGAVSSDDAVLIKEDLVKIKARLLKNAPAPADMRRQIRREVLSEISVLHKRAKKIMKSGKKANFFELANVVKKIRLLKGLLSSLLKSSLDNLKTLWLRFVHGK